MSNESVTVIVLTFRRPDGLREAIPQLLTAIDGQSAGEVLVVDNDERPSAAEIVAEFADPRLRYVHEPHPGIAAARNRGLEETKERDIVVFIDDDERPREHWLELLLEQQRSTGAQAVSGPVISEYEGVLDPWIVAGRFFQHPRYPTGTVIPVAATNNLLLVRPFVEQIGLRFDLDFGLSGGEDSVFTREITKAGGRIVWCDEAIVTDVIPPNRATKQWVRQRAFRLGNSEARARIKVASTRAGRWREVLVVAGRALLRMGGGSARILVGVVTGSLENRARGQRALLRGAGMVTAIFGHQRLEYARSSPAPS